MDKNFALYILEKSKEDYNLIAENYARTRSFVPHDIKSLSEYASEGSRILDSGCANGRLFEAFKEKNINYLGIDYSKKLIEIAKKKYPGANFQIADALNLPFKENSFDIVYSMAVLHHIPSKELRMRYLEEARRVLRPGGSLILRVWDFWKMKRCWMPILKYTFLKLTGKSKLDFFDIYVPWKDSAGKVLAQRYFHCLTKRELQNLAKKTGFKVKQIWRENIGLQSNIYLIAKK